MRPLLILALLCPFWGRSQATAFTAADAPDQTIFASSTFSQPLTIGDILPLEFLDLPNPAARLTIIDFWATWCTACLSSFRKLDSFQQQFGPQLGVLMVNARSTGDNPTKIAAFFESRRRADGSKYTLPLRSGDTVLHTLFPYKLIPHHVWIGAGRRILAITGEEELTAANISAAIAGSPLHLKLKKDVFNYDPQKPLLQDGNGGEAPAVSTVFTGRLEGLPSQATRLTVSGHRKLVLLNLPPAALYREVLLLTPNRIRPEGLDSLRFNGSGAGDNRFCFEITVPPNTPDSDFQRLAVQGLNVGLGLYGRWERRTLPCWVLQKGSGCTWATKGGKPSAHWYSEKKPLSTVQNKPLSVLLIALNSQAYSNPQAPVVVDETGITGNVNLQLAVPLTNFPLLAEALKACDLRFFPATRDLAVFVISPQPAEPRDSDQ